MRRRVLLAAAFCLATIVAAGVAQAAPRDGGDTVTAPLEAAISAAASQTLGKPVSLFCEDESAWASLMAEYGYSRTTLGIAFADEGQAFLAPSVCSWADTFWLASDKEALHTCQFGTVTSYANETRVQRVKVCKRLKVKGRWVKRCHFETRKVKVRVARQVPVYEDCVDWPSIVHAVGTIAHEVEHLRGQTDEGLTECAAIEHLPWWAEVLGASPTLGATMARDYWLYVYSEEPAAYRSGNCPEP
jgi:hypothetical protein